MSRSGYCDDIDEWALIRWRGAVRAAIKGKRGQAFLREMLAALDALPVKRLIQAELIDDEGEVCAIGSVCKARGLDVSNLDESEPDDIASAVGIAQALVREIAYVNDECEKYVWNGNERARETPEQRFDRVRAWVEKQIVVCATRETEGGEK